MDRLHRVSMKNAACCVNYHELQTLRMVNFRTHSTVGSSHRYVWFRVVYLIVTVVFSCISVHVNYIRGLSYYIAVGSSLARRRSSISFEESQVVALKKRHNAACIVLRRASPPMMLKSCEKRSSIGDMHTLVWFVSNASSVGVLEFFNLNSVVITR